MIKNRFTWKSFFQSHLFFVVGLVVLILLSINLTKTQFKDKSIRSEIAGLQAEVDALEKEKTQYNDLLSLFGTSEFLESEARRSLGYVKPGEKVVVIDKGEVAKSDEAQDVGKLSNPRKWLTYFFMRD